MEALKARIKRHEGFSDEPYRCPAGYWTVGYGHFMGQGGCKISQRVADALLDEDIDKATFGVASLGFDFLDQARTEVLIEMAFNLGLKGLMRFKKMMAALEAENYEAAADEMLDSKWAKQVTRRAVELSDVMRSGACKPNY